MVSIELPPDFKEFLKLLSEHQVEYLLIGGYAVAYHGYPRATADLDVWIKVSPQNAPKLVTVLNQFGFKQSEISETLFLTTGKIIRLGVPPIRIEIATSISGIEFHQAYESRIEEEFDGVPVKIIDLNHLKANKRAAGRHKDRSRELVDSLEETLPA